MSDAELEKARKAVRSLMRTRGRASEPDPDEALTRYEVLLATRFRRRGIVEGVVMAREAAEAEE